MELLYLGHAAVKIKTKTATIIIDPFNPSIGLPWHQQAADILLMSHQHDDHHHAQGVEAGFIAEGPGEYEVKEISITGTRLYHDAVKGAERGPVTAFTVMTENVSVCHLGDLGHELSTEQIESLQSPDVLLIPVGGTYTIDGAAAAKVVSQLEPRVVVPIHYQVPELQLPEPLEGYEPFMKALGLEAWDTLPSLKITRDTLAEELKVVVLETRKG